jgi:hypothetical protein
MLFFNLARRTGVLYKYSLISRFPDSSDFKYVARFYPELHSNLDHMTCFEMSLNPMGFTVSLGEGRGRQLPRSAALSAQIPTAKHW